MTKGPLPSPGGALRVCGAGSARGLAGEVRRDDEVLGHEVVHRRPAQPHEPRAQAAAQDLEDVLHAGLAGGGEAPEGGPGDRDGAGAERERLDDVAAAADAAVQDDLDVPA